MNRNNIILVQLIQLVKSLYNASFLLVGLSLQYHKLLAMNLVLVNDTGMFHMNQKLT